MSVLNLWPIPAVLLPFLLGVWIGFRSAVANQRINGLIDAADYLADLEAEQEHWGADELWATRKAPAPGLSGAVEGSPPGMSPHKPGGEHPTNRPTSHRGW